MKFFWLLMLVAFSVFGVIGPASAEKVSKALVVQVNGDKEHFERALKLASNMRESLRHTKFEIVVYGPAVQFLTELSDEVPLIQKMQEEGMTVIACGRSLETDHVKEDTLAAGIKVIPFGAVHIVNQIGRAHV